MQNYLNIVENVLLNGSEKKNRTGIKTYSTFCEIFRHKMTDGFPLLTTKKMPFRTVAVELEGFIKGITDKNWYRERNCKIWNNWANPKAVDFALGQTSEMDDDLQSEIRKTVQYSEPDLGPIYGYQRS